MKTHLLTLLLLGSIVSGIAQTWTGAVDNAWENPNNWFPMMVPSAGPVTIPGGSTVVISVPEAFSFDMTSAGTIINNTTVTSSGNIINFAGGGAFVNNGSFSNFGSFDNDGTFDNNGKFNNYGSVEHSGSFTNTPGSIVQNRSGASILNTGLVTNDGALHNIGTFNNNTTFNNNSNYSNFGTLNLVNGSNYNNNANGVLANYGTISCTFGNISNTGTIINHACQEILYDNTADVNGTIINYGLIRLLDTGVVNTTTNEGSVVGESEPYLELTCSDITVSNDPGSCEALLTPPPPTYNMLCGTGGALGFTSGNNVDTSGTDIYAYEEAGFNIATVGAGSGTNYFDLSGENACMYSATSQGITINLGGNPFSVLSIGIDAISNNAGIRFTSSSGAVTLSANTGVYIFPNSADWQGITSIQIDFDPNMGGGSDTICIDNLAYCLAPDDPVNSVTGTSDATGTYLTGFNLINWTWMSCGQTAVCTQTVVVQDNEAPVFNCPNDITVQLGPGECRAIVNFAPEATDNCSVPTVTQTMGPLSGTEFERNTTSFVVFSAWDNAGNSSSCSFNVIVEDFVPPGGALACNDTVRVSLDGFCQAEITADMVLGGNQYGCYEDYPVVLAGNESNIVDPTDIGDAIQVSVFTPDSTNYCWGWVVVEDKLKPVLTCPPATTVQCFESIDPQLAGDPTVADCSEFSTSFVDDQTNFACPDSIQATIVRHWTAADIFGNSDSCVQMITVLRADGPLDFPPNMDGLDSPALLCDGQYPLDENGNPHPGLTGYPAYNGIDIQGDGICDFLATYLDQRPTICEGTDKIIRAWTVLNWCTGATFDHTQTITLADQQAPALSCPDDMTISTIEAACNAVYTLIQPVISDNCSDVESIAVTLDAAGTIVGNTLQDLPVGVHVLTYTSTDPCNNASTCSYSLTVKDEVTPVPVCETHTVVTLSSIGEALVQAITFDDGSVDNCSPVDFLVRRMETICAPESSFAEHVLFDCCDVGNGPLMIELQITDESGNTNSCMVEIVVEDKLGPSLICPADQTIACDEEYWELEQFGQPLWNDNCQVDTTLTEVVEVNNCGAGTVIRTWVATDGNPAQNSVCTQVIEIRHNSDFVVTFPKDFTVNNCGDLNDSGEPVFFLDDCELIAATYEDQLYNVVANACYTILRTWTVINWCNYYALNPDITPLGDWYEGARTWQDDGDGYFQYVQTIEVQDNEAPAILSSCADTTFCDFSTCGEGLVQLSLEATDACADANSLIYRWKIDLGNDGSVDLESGSGSENTASGTFVYGTHKIWWEVEDGCNNTSFCSYLFSIRDCKNPTAYCLNGLSVDLMVETGTVNLSATDFDAGSFDNCGVAELRIATLSGGPDQTVPPPAGQDEVSFGCLQLGTNTVDLWVMDVNNNWDYCTTYVVIQDNMGACSTTDPESATIAGSIMTEAGDGVEQVLVHISNSSLPPGQTTVQGTYLFTNLTAGNNYTLSPEKNNDFGNGVTTFDLVLITKHILGSQFLDSPYKMIAADANRSGTITTLDLVYLRKLILLIEEEIAGNTSWRFIDGAYVFPNPADPFANPIPEQIAINNLSAEEQANFVAVKIGDVNGSAVVNSLANNDPRDFTGELIFGVEDAVIIAGQEISVNLKARSFYEISGYQYTFSFDKDVLDFIRIDDGELVFTRHNFGMTFLEDGIITATWNNPMPSHWKVNDDDILFSFVFNVKKTAQLSDVVALNSRYTLAEAYRENLLDESYEFMQVRLEFEPLEGVISKENEFTLYQNQPNPFMDETIIGFILPEAGSCTFSVYDLSGRVIKDIQGAYAEGYNEIRLHRNDLNGNGVYYYRLEQKWRNETRLMLITE